MRPEHHPYCEYLPEDSRWLMDWAEPLNTLTNLGFVLVGLWGLWIFAPAVFKRRKFEVRGAGAGVVVSLGVIFIGLGSWLFHMTQAYVMADVTPIVLTLCLYLAFWTYRFAAIEIAEKRWVAAALSPLLLIAVSIAIAVLVYMTLPNAWFTSSSPYFGTLLFLALIAKLSYTRAQSAHLLGFAALSFAASLTFRSLDLPFCNATLELGLHTFWHLLNALSFLFALEFWRRNSRLV